MTTKKEIKTKGYYWMRTIPENNYRKPFQHCIEQGFSWDEEEVFIKEAAFNEFFEAEQNQRQFTPFEFTARELNELAETESYDPWEVFEEGCDAYCEQWWSRHAEDLYLKMQAELNPSTVET